MSVILDALRKLDREKSSRRKGTANIAVEILRSDLTRTGRRMPIYIVTVAVAAIAAAAITYGVMSEFGFLSKPSPPASKAIPAPSQQVAPAFPESAVPSKLSVPAPASPSAASQQVAPAPAPHVPVRNAQEEVSRASLKVQTPAENKDRADVKIPVESKSPATPVVDKKQSQDIIPKETNTAPVSTKKIPEPTPNISAANPASLKLSAIVWYEEPSRRFAMINGIMATEGSSVEGAKVVEINPTSVRLLHDGQYFEISMSK